MHRADRHQALRRCSLTQPFWVAALALSLLGCGEGDGEGPGVSDSGTTGQADSNPTARKRVFVTSATWQGNIADWNNGAMGPTVADELCTLAAEGAGMAGRWIAWLSAHGWANPQGVELDDMEIKDRIEDVGPWYLVGEDTVVFNNRANLLNTPLVPINRDEHGNRVEEGRVWTGTEVGGSLAIPDSCTGWRSAVSLNDTGVAGDLAATTNAWTNAGWLGCGELAHLYCIEQ